MIRVLSSGGPKAELSLCEPGFADLKVTLTRDAAEMTHRVSFKHQEAASPFWLQSADGRRWVTFTIRFRLEGDIPGERQASEYGAVVNIRSAGGKKAVPMPWQDVTPIRRRLIGLLNDWLVTQEAKQLLIGFDQHALAVRAAFLRSQVAWYENETERQRAAAVEAEERLLAFARKHGLAPGLPTVNDEPAREPGTLAALLAEIR